MSGDISFFIPSPPRKYVKSKKHTILFRQAKLMDKLPDYGNVNGRIIRLIININQIYTTLIFSYYNSVGNHACSS